jgi:hypothetical protein
VLLLQAVASSSKNQLLVASAACARLPTQAPGAVTSSSTVAPVARLGKSQDISAAMCRVRSGQRTGKEHCRRILRQAVEAQRLQLDLPVKGDDSNLRKFHVRPRFSRLSCIIAPAFQPLVAAAYCMVVPEASTSCGWFSRTFSVPSKQRTSSRPPSAFDTTSAFYLLGFGSAQRMKRGCNTKRAAPRHPAQHARGRLEREQVLTRKHSKPFVRRFETCLILDLSPW